MKKKLYFNSAISLVYQIVVVIVGLILPRLMLTYYGSAVNGVVQSITQLLSVIALLDLGVGAVVQAALYKPLSENDTRSISKIYCAARIYFRIIATILVFYIIGLCVYYGVFKSAEFSWMYSVGIILAIAIGYFAQYFFGICNTLLLYSDQKIYICTFINLITLIISTAVSIVLIINGASIQIVKLTSSVVFLARPIYLAVYVKRHYLIEHVAGVSLNEIPEKWSGLSQHVATILSASIDSILLTIFSTFKLISVYNVYVMPLNAIRNLMEVTSTSYKSFFGSIIAKQNKNLLLEEFEKYELITHFIVTVIFCAVAKVLTPFVLLYTKGVTDVEYRDTFFCMIITCAYALYTLRLTYSNIIFAGGKFKETQKYSIIEVILNLVISIILIKPFGLSGVAIGTCVSSAYRMFSLAYYLKRDIINRPYRKFLKHISIDVICVIACIFTTKMISISTLSILEWIVGGTLTCIICFAVCAVITMLFYREFGKVLLRKISFLYNSKCRE